MPRALPSASSSSMKMMHGAFCLRLIEEIAHARGADAHEHLDEVGAADREERDARLTGHRARQQRLAGAGRSDQQDALGQLRAQPSEPRGRLQEVDHLAQLLLGLVDAGDVGEFDRHVLLHVHLGLAAADGHEAVLVALAHPARDHRPESNQQRYRQQPRHGIAPERRLDDAGDADVVLVQVAEQLGIFDAHGVEPAAWCRRRGGAPARGRARHRCRGDCARYRRRTGVILVVAVDVGRADHHFIDRLRRDRLLEIAIGDLLRVQVDAQYLLEKQRDPKCQDHVANGELELLLGFAAAFHLSSQPKLRRGSPSGRLRRYDPGRAAVTRR